MTGEESCLGEFIAELAAARVEIARLKDEVRQAKGRAAAIQGAADYAKVKRRWTRWEP